MRARETQVECKLWFTKRVYITEKLYLGLFGLKNIGHHRFLYTLNVIESQFIYICYTRTCKNHLFQLFSSIAKSFHARGSFTNSKLTRLKFMTHSPSIHISVLNPHGFPLRVRYIYIFLLAFIAVKIILSLSLSLVENNNKFFFSNFFLFNEIFVW